MKKHSPLRIIAHKLRINGRYPSDYRNRLTSRTSNVCPCLINFSDPADKARHDRMVTLVTQIPDLNKKVPDTRPGQEKIHLSLQVTAMDVSPDTRGYKLYRTEKI